MTPAVVVTRVATRRLVGLYGVDTATVVFAAAGSFPDAEFACVDQAGPGWVASMTGYGDGRYEVFAVEEEGVVVGVETVFVLPEAEDGAAEAVGPCPLAPGRRTAVLRDQATPAEAKAYRRWMHAHRVAHEAAWEALVHLVDPAAALVPESRGSIEIGDSVEVGDPCRGPAVVVELPPGTYQAVAWAHRGATARFGLYRTPFLD